MKKFLIIIEKNESNFSAYSPDLPGCIATGNSIKEVKLNINDAIDFHIEGLLLENLKIPEPQASYEYYSLQE